jgi:hypothetical protein
VTFELEDIEVELVGEGGVRVRRTIGTPASEHMACMAVAAADGSMSG